MRDVFYSCGVYSGSRFNSFNSDSTLTLEDGKERKNTPKIIFSLFSMYLLHRWTRRGWQKVLTCWRRQGQTPAPRLLTKTFNMGGNGESLAHGRIWSGPLKLLLPALEHVLCEVTHSTTAISFTLFTLNIDILLVDLIKPEQSSIWTSTWPVTWPLSHFLPCSECSRTGLSKVVCFFSLSDR